MKTAQNFMRRAIELSGEYMRAGLGGPFGAIIVRGQEILAEGCNRVTSTNDPTAHAEMVAIREACRHIGGFSLAGCELYTSCEPCPMCLGALYWAELDRVLFAVSGDEAARFYPGERRYHRAVDFYAQYTLPFAQRRLPMQLERREEGVRLFEHWKDLN